MHLICPPPHKKKNLHNLCFSFLLGITAVPREIKNNAYARFWGQIRCIMGDEQVAYKTDISLRVCLHGGGGAQIGEVTWGGSAPHLSCKRDQIKMRDYMDRQVTPPKRVWKQALRRTLSAGPKDIHRADSIPLESVANGSYNNWMFHFKKKLKHLTRKRKCGLHYPVSSKWTLCFQPFDSSHRLFSPEQKQQLSFSHKIYKKPCSKSGCYSLQKVESIQ